MISSRFDLKSSGSGERAFRRGHSACLPRIDLGCGAQCARNGLEACLGYMVIIGAIMIEDMQGDAGILR
jgi:hypothetical protein